MKQPRSTPRGSTLVAAVLFVAIISGATGIAFLATTTLGRNVQRTRQYENIVAVGDAHLEWAFAQWRSKCRSQSNVALPTQSFSTLTAPSAAWLTQPVGYTISDFKIEATDVQGNVINSSVKPPIPAQGQSSSNNSYFDRASVTVKAPTMTKTGVTANLRRIFEKRIESPWEYAIFYNDDLEIHPSPKFTVTGWVHTNGTLYASPDGGQPLIFNERVSYADAYKMGYMDGDWQGRGLSNANGKAPGNTFAANLPAANESRKDFFGITPTQFDPSASNKNDDSYRELIEMPESGNDPLSDGTGENPRFYNAASVRVEVDKDNNIKVRNGDGKLMLPNSPNAAEKLFYNTVVGALTTNQAIQDYREAASVRLVSLDVGKLDSSKIAGWNGVVYISDRSATAATKRGVRLRNGTTLPEGGLTVASDNPVYIQGNYNTAGVRQPAAVMGDAIMILSNNWKDANSTADINSANRKATDTTINTAILGGIVTTDPAVKGKTSYSGGVENFPRFMENWDGKKFTYSGSMVQLFESKQATGRWGFSNQSYSAPIREWAYETLFRTSPPPGTLFITTYNKHRWYVE